MIRAVDRRKFRQLFRVSLIGFEKLMGTIGPDILLLAGGSGAVSPQQRVFATLRWLAGGSVLDISML
jgi:hypothetical protein